MPRCDYTSHRLPFDVRASSRRDISAQDCDPRLAARDALQLAVKIDKHGIIRRRAFQKADPAMG